MGIDEIGQGQDSGRSKAAGNDLAAEESAGADVEIHAATIRAKQFLGDGFEGKGQGTD